MAEVIRSTSLDDRLPGWVQQEWLDGRTWLLEAHDLPLGKGLSLLQSDLAAVAAQSGLVVDCRRVKRGLEVRAYRDRNTLLARARRWVAAREGELVSMRDIQRALRADSTVQLQPVVAVLANEGRLQSCPEPKRPYLWRVTAPESAA